MGTCNKESVLQRINEFREYAAISKSTLAASIGVEQTTLNNQLIGKRGLSLDTIIAMLSTFSDLSSEWLFRDRGNMFLKKYDGSLEANALQQSERIEKLFETIESLQKSIDQKSKVNDLNAERVLKLVDTISTLQDTINAKDDTIKAKDSIITTLQDTINSKDETIAALNERIKQLETQH